MTKNFTKGYPAPAYYKVMTEIQREIEELERANRRMFDEIDQNEHQVTILQQILTEVGTPADR